MYKVTNETENNAHFVSVSHPIAFNPLNNVGWMNLCLGSRVDTRMVPYIRDISGRFYELSVQSYGLIKGCDEPKTFIQDIELYQNYLSGNYSKLSLDLAEEHDYFDQTEIISDGENIIDESEEG